MPFPAQALACWFFLGSLSACGGGAAPSLPRLGERQGMDPFVLERVDQALAACDRGEPGALLELAKTYDANGLPGEALEVYGRCLAAHAPREGGPGRATLEYLRAQTLAALGRPEAALAGFEAALAAGDAYAPTHWRRGELLLELGRLAEARVAFQAALALEPHSIPPQLGLARLDLLEDDPGDVLARLGPLAEEARDERFVHGLLARAYRAVGDEDAAARELAREERSQHVSLSDPRSAEVATRAVGILSAIDAANAFLGRAQPDEAVALLAPLHERAPEDLALALVLGKALTEARKPEQATQVLEQALARHPDQFQLELFLGQALAQRKAFRKAEEHLMRARTLNPAFGPTHAALGEVETKLGRFPEAEVAFARALETGEDSLRTRLLLTEVQFQQQAFERALASAEAACAAFPNAAGAWAYVAEARCRVGRLADARQALEEAERRNPDYERLAAVRALLARGNQDATPR